MNSAEAKAIMEQDRKERTEKAMQGIQEVLELYKCKIDVSVILRAGQVIPQIQILPQDE